MKLLTLFLALATSCTSPLLLVAQDTAQDTAQDQKSTDAGPDFTRGDKRPDDSRKDWNLGPTGLRGWIHSDRLVTKNARQILVTQVQPNSSADGIFRPGDVILGVNGQPFSSDPRTEFANAITFAESQQGAGKLNLTRWRAGESVEVQLPCEVLGTYSPTAPYDCPKSQRLFELGCQALADRMAKPSYPEPSCQDPIPRSLNALALLASGNPDYLPLVQKEAQWAANFNSRSMQTWHYGYCIMLLSEYVLATDDRSVMPGLQRLALQAAKGQSAVGSWGHGFALGDGRLGGYGMMNAPGLPLTIALVLAQQAGVDDPKVSLAIERSCRLLRFYIGKGAIPYGDHHPWIETHEDNGKCGMAAVLFNLLDESQGAEFFSRMSVASHGPERDCGHTGNYFNMLWAIPGVSQSGPNATGHWMAEFGASYFDFARTYDGSYSHQGPPEPDHDSYHGWDATGGYLLSYAIPGKKLYLTGRRPNRLPLIDPATAKSLILDGRGWDNQDRNSTYDAYSIDQLFERLSSWSPVVRERASLALARRKKVPIEPLTEMLTSENLQARYGACQALAALRRRGAPAVAALESLLDNDDLWLRIKAAEALAAIGPAAMQTVPQLLELLATTDQEHDPRGMQQRYMAFALFDQPNGMLNRSLDGVDREALYRAVRVGLVNQDGRARGSIGSVYRNLSSQDIQPLLPAIFQAIVEPAPSGEMFADTIRVEGLELLAQHRIAEGIRACVQYTRDQNPWASEKRTPELMKILLSYGKHAQEVIPELIALADYFEKEEKNFPKELKLLKAQIVRQTIRQIEASNDAPVLRSIDSDPSE